MDLLGTQFRFHYKKILLLCSASVTVFYFIKKYLNKKRDIRSKQNSRIENNGRKRIKDFPSIAQVQKFIEELPFDPVSNAKKSIKLSDLLGELSEFSEDDEWKGLIASVQTMCDDNKQQNVKNLCNKKDIYNYSKINTHSQNQSSRSTDKSTNCEASNINKDHGDVADFDIITTDCLGYFEATEHIPTDIGDTITHIPKLLQ